MTMLYLLTGTVLPSFSQANVKLKPSGASHTQASHINECKNSIPSCMVHCYLKLAGEGGRSIVPKWKITNLSYDNV